MLPEINPFTGLIIYKNRTKIMTYINTSTDKYQNNITKQSYLKLSLFHDLNIPLYPERK